MKFFIHLANSKRVSICLTACRVILGHEVALSPSILRVLWSSNLRGRLQVLGSIRSEISITDELYKSETQVWCFSFSKAARFVTLEPLHMYHSLLQQFFSVYL